MSKIIVLLVCVVTYTFGLSSVPASRYLVKEHIEVPHGWTKVEDGPKGTIRLEIGLQQQHASLIEQHLQQVSDPKHSRYGKYLTAAEVDNIVAPSRETYQLVVSWLHAHGIMTFTQSSAKDWIQVTLPVKEAEDLLQTNYSRYQHIDGTTLLRTTEWSLPVHLHAHIDVVQPTTSFLRPRRDVILSSIEPQYCPGGCFEAEDPVQKSRPRRDAILSSIEPQYCPGGCFEADDPAQKSRLRKDVDPMDSLIAETCNASHVDLDCLRLLYGTQNYTAQAPNQNSIAVANYLNQTNYRADIRQFLNMSRPEAISAADAFPIHTIAGADNDQGPYTMAQLQAAKNLEGDLDAEMAIGISWPTSFSAYSTGGSPPYVADPAEPTDGNEPYLTFLNSFLAQPNPPRVLSTSYGDDEQSVPESYARRVCSGFAQLGVRGVSVISSSGDHGVGGQYEYCYSNSDPNREMFVPTFPASCPWVTVVGATAGYQPEVATTQFGSGAGFSDIFLRPFYQQQSIPEYIDSLDGLYNGLYNKAGRAYPDVAAHGDRVAIVWAGRSGTIGGTSVASPIFAAVISLVNDALIAHSRPPLGFLNPWIYGGAHVALTDITSGSSIGCNGSGFPAQAGWDAVTGWGTPNFGPLVKAAFAL